MHTFFMKSILYMCRNDNLGELINLVDSIHSFFSKENVRYLVWTCKDPISLVLGTRFLILRTRIGSLKHLKKPAIYEKSDHTTKTHCSFPRPQNLKEKHLTNMLVLTF